MKFIFEEISGQEFWTQLVSKIPWGHTNLIFQQVKDTDQRIFYLKACIRGAGVEEYWKMK